MINSVKLIIGAGKDKKQAYIKQQYILDNYSNKCYIGVGLTKQWETEYCIIAHGIDIYNCFKLQEHFKEECIILDNYSRGYLHGEINESGCSIGKPEAKRAIGKLDDLFKPEVGQALLEREGVEAITCFEVPCRKGYTILKYKEVH